MRKEPDPRIGLAAIFFKTEGELAVGPVDTRPHFRAVHTVLRRRCRRDRVRRSLDRQNSGTQREAIRDTDEPQYDAEQDDKVYSLLNLEGTRGFCPLPYVS